MFERLLWPPEDTKHRIISNLSGVFETSMANYQISAPLCALAASMSVVRDYQIGNKTRTGITEIKPDDTYVTLVDRESGEAGMEYLKHLQSIYAIRAEDVKGRDNPDASHEVHDDHLDGTNAFLLGLPTSTVIISDYDRIIRQVVTCLIGEPIRSRFWFAAEDTPTVRISFRPGKLVLSKPEEVKVWQGELSIKKSTVFLDVSHGFTRGGRQILTDENVSELFRRVNKRTKILMPGSNGLMHALMADGGEGLAGCITTAMGGPWDGAGVKLVKAAGGFARGFHLLPGSAVEVDPLNPHAFDCAILANSPKNLDILTDEFLASIR